MVRVDDEGEFHLDDPNLKQAQVARDALQQAELAARKAGLGAEWYKARPPDQPFAGLSNQGATCYLNSLLQALFVSDEVREEIFRFEYSGKVLHGPAE
eukprot:5537478-Pleurochrysis_carterae.AAC.2